MQESGQLSDSAAPLSSHLSWDASCKQIQVLFDNMPWKWWSSNSMLIADERHLSKELCSWHYLTFFGNPQRSQGANSHEGWIAFVAAAVPSSGCSAWPAADGRGAVPVWKVFWALGVAPGINIPFWVQLWVWNGVCFANSCWLRTPCKEHQSSWTSARGKNQRWA